MIEHVCLTIACIGMALAIIGWRAEAAERASLAKREDDISEVASTALDRLAEERRLHPRRGERGRFTKRSSFGTDRPVG